MKKIYNMAIIGFGGMGSWHNELINSIEGLKLKGICDISPVRQEFARKKGIYVYNTREEVFADPEIDFVLIATPNDLHKLYAIEAMKAGKDVVSEKPVTLSSYDLQEMIDASVKYNRLFTVHQNRRWDEDFLTIRKLAESNMLGQICRIESRVHGSRGIPGDWRQEKEHGGGMVLDWGVHLLDQILMMKGKMKLNYVHANLMNITNQLVDDGFTAMLVFEDGVEVLVEVGTSNFILLPRWYVIGQNGTAVINDWDSNCEIVCAAGEDEKDVVPVRTAAGLTKTMAPRRKDTVHKKELPKVRSDIRDFYRNVMKAIAGEEEIIVKLPEVMRVMKLIEAIFESANEHKVVVFEK